MKNKILRGMICSVQQSENIDLEMVVTMVVLMFFNEFEPCSLLSFYQILFPNLKGKALVLQFLCDIQSERLHKLRYYDSCHNGWIMVHKDLPHYFINEDGFVWSIDWTKVNEGVPKDDDLYLIQDEFGNIGTAYLNPSISSKFIKFTAFTAYFTDVKKWADIKPIGVCYECFK